ncbi:MAG: PQQ-binding-like beta-propeller repeat protein [Planctomycetes bacterium]|nr:PQQ-binding-like beta-propeller repeat protein [Planctomycetota bacterium]
MTEWIDPDASPPEPPVDLAGFISAGRAARPARVGEGSESGSPPSAILQSILRLELAAAAETARGVPRDEHEAAAIDLGRYRDVRAIGQGGMGTVFRAVDPDTGRTVAIKVARRGMGENALRRFVAEGRVTAQLEHPNIVPVHELGLAPNGRVYFSMKLVRGRSLAQILAEGRPGPAELPGLLRTFLRVCEAVSFAHSRGVIHRDLKPANIMVGRFGEVVVMDWGVARVLGCPSEAEEEAVRAHPEGDEAPHVTKAGTVLGTLLYMPPEQAAGLLDRIDERSDVYGLGAILYEILALRPAFEGPVAQVRLQVLEGLVPRPSDRAPGRAIPAELEAVVTKAMAAKPADRYPTAVALASDVEAWLDVRPLAAMRYSAIARAAKWARRRRSILVPAAAAVLFVLVFTIVAAIHAFTRPGTLVLSIEPEGARATIADESHDVEGESLRLTVPAGRHDVLVERPGYVAFHREEYVRRGETREIPVHLVRETGFLAVESDPEGGLVRIGGITCGTPVRSLALPTGRWTVEVERRGGYGRTLEVDIRPGATTSLAVNLPDAVLWSRRGDAASARRPGDVDGDGIEDLMFIHFYVRLVLLSGADGRLLYEKDLPVEAFTDGRIVERPGGGVRRWVTCLSDERGFRLAAFELDDGETAWTTPPLPILRHRDVGLRDTPDPLFEVAADLDGDGSFDPVALLEGNILAAFGSADGRELWRHALDAVLWPPRRDADRDGDGLADLFLERSGVFRSIGGGSGSLLWTGRLDSERAEEWTLWRDDWVAGSVAGTLFVSPARERSGVLEGPGRTWTSGPWLLAIDADGSGVARRDDGEPAWRRRLPEEFAERLVSPRAGLAVGLGAGGRSLLAIDLETGRDSWSWSAAGAIDRVDVVGEGSVLVSAGSSIHLVSAEGGRGVWGIELPAPIACPPVAVAGEKRDGFELAIATSAGHLVVVDQDGRRVFEARIETMPSRISDLALDHDGLTDYLVDSPDGPTAVSGRRVLWRVETGAAVRAAPVLHDAEADGVPEVFLPISSREARGEAVVSIDGRTGAIRWSETHVHNMIRPIALVDRTGDGRPEIATWHVGGFLRFLDARTGRVVEDLTAPAFGYAEPTVGELDGDGVPDLVAAGWWGEGGLAAWSGETGERLWEAKAGGPVWSGPTVAQLPERGAEVYLATTSGDVLCLEGRTGRERWRRALGSILRAGVSVGRFGPGRPLVVLASGSEGDLFVLEATDGHLIGRVQGAGGSTATPVFGQADDDEALELVLGLGSGGLACLDDEGAFLWRFESAPVQATPVIADLDGDGRSEVVAGDSAGRVWCLDLGSGRHRWSWTAPSRKGIEGRAAVADLDGDGNQDVVVGTGDGSIYALSGRCP